MFDHFSPKRAFLVSWGTEFGQKTGKWSVFSSYNPKFSILEPKCGPKKIWKFWSHGPPWPPPYPPWHPPGVRGGQKWPKCIPLSPIMIVNAKKNISGGSKILTYFFTRNVPSTLGMTMSYYAKFNKNSIQLLSVYQLFMTKTRRMGGSGLFFFTTISFWA